MGLWNFVLLPVAVLIFDYFEVTFEANRKIRQGIGERWSYGDLPKWRIIAVLMIGFCCALPTIIDGYVELLAMVIVALIITVCVPVYAMKRRAR